MEQRLRMSGAERRQQILRIAAAEFAAGGLHGTSAEVIARRAGITQAYVFRMFGTKKALFIAVGGLVLAAGTAAGDLFPASGAYTAAAWTGAAVMAVSAVTSLIR